MKRKTAILAHTCLILAILLAGSQAIKGRARPCGQPAQGKVLRLHILANSDDPADQAAKLRVRDALLPLFETSDSYESARAFVLRHGSEILQLCQDALKACGKNYSAQLLLGVADFPDRTYGAAFFPAGAYDALQIVLGEGAGHNWWCVLFPPLCVVTADGAAPEASEGFLFESQILTFLRTLFGKETSAVPVETSEPLCYDEANQLVRSGYGLSEDRRV